MLLKLHPPRRRRGLTAVALIALLANCDAPRATAPHPVVPDTVTPSAVSASASEWTPVGAAFTAPAPPVLGQFAEQGFMDWTPTSLVITERQTVRVRVTGTYAISQNPAMAVLCYADWDAYEIQGEPDCTLTPPAPSAGPMGIPLGVPYYGGKLAVHLLLRARDHPGVFIPLELLPDDPNTAEAVLELPPGVIEMSRPGFMCRYHSHVYNRVEGCFQFTGTQYITVERLTKRAADLSLSCTGDLGTNRVTRGESITCTAAKDPAEANGTLSDVQWSFTDTAGHTIFGPAGSLSWHGRMVIGGDLRVAAKLDGKDVSSVAPIFVVARTWPKMSLTPFDGGHGTLLEFPTETSHLAQTHGPVPGGPVDTFTIHEGPNQGWSYLVSPITSVRVEVNISDGFNVGTPLYQKQHSGVVPGKDEAYCSKAQFRNGVQTAARRHEGITPGATLSHVEVMRRWFSAASPETAMEAVIAHQSDFTDGTSFTEYVGRKFSEHVTEPAMKDPNQAHTTDHPPGLVPYPDVPCRPRLYNSSGPGL